MVKKLRKRFILYSFLAIFSLLSVIFASINIYGFVSIANDGDRVTEMIQKNNGKMDRPEPPTNPLLNIQAAPVPEGDMKASVRYFTYKIDKSTLEVTEVANEMYEAVTAQTAIAWTKELYKKSVGWKETYFRYRSYKLSSDPGFTYVTVIDMTRELIPTYRILWWSLGGYALALAISFAVLFVSSKYIVKPIVDTDRKQRRFIDSAAKQIKEPLEIIKNHHDMLVLEKGETEVTKKIKKELNHLDLALSELTELTKLYELNDIQHESFNMSEVTKEICESYREAFTSKGYKYDVEIEDNIIFNGDALLYKRLIDIILENAKKYAEGDVTFSLKKDNDRILIKQTNVSTAVKDGPMDTVFEKFYRENEKDAGVGLSLVIAKEIVKRFKGRILANGKDNTFILKVEL